MPSAHKHIFLTGSVQIGKSTILKAIMDENRDRKLGGLFTRWINKSNSTRAGLYMFPAERKVVDAVYSACSSEKKDEAEILGERLLSARNLIATFESGNYKKKILYKDVFNELGRQYLKKAKNCELILIDEIGILEDKAYAFQEEVLSLLNGTTPIIGVVRNKSGILTDAVKSHPNVEVIEVTRTNRDQLKNELPQRVKQFFH